MFKSSSKSNSPILFQNNILLIILIAIILFAMGYFFMSKQSEINIYNKTGGEEKTPFSNPYYPPLRNNLFINGGGISDIGSGGYSQVGILKSKSNDTVILPLFGKPLHTRRDSWLYYTVSNNNNSTGIKLNIKNEKGKSLMDEYGAPELYNDDNVLVDGYDTQMKVSIYPQQNLFYS